MIISVLFFQINRGFEKQEKKLVVLAVELSIFDDNKW